MTQLDIQPQEKIIQILPGFSEIMESFEGPSRARIASLANRVWSGVADSVFKRSRVSIADI